MKDEEKAWRNENMRNITRIQASSFSKYRSELMGIASILVLIVHSFTCRVNYYPQILNSLLSKSLIGVDIFLLVSGFGVYWSLDNNSDKKNFWLRRAARILPIYLPLVIVFALWKFFGGGQNGNVIEYLSYVSTISVWRYNSGAWYVAVLIPIYFSAPFIYDRLKKISNGLLFTIVLSVAVYVICALANYASFFTYSTQIHHFSRVISFIIGMYFGKMAKENKSINSCILLLVGILLRIGINRILPFSYSEFALMLIVVAVLTVIFQVGESYKYFQKVRQGLRWLGNLSLEIYLINYMLREPLRYYGYMKVSDGTNTDAVLYLVVVLLTIILAQCYHVCILPKIKSWFIRGKNN